MSFRVLFVDDDEMLLASMQRCLGLKFEIEIATSGPAALAAMQASTPPPVLVSDMRMPVMDGIEFIERARAQATGSVFVMLTGNQDVHTAVRAVNEGRVFRFLNKPCDPADIAATIEQAHRQYELQTAERDLLDQTFAGALGVFADVIESLSPDLLRRAAATEQIVEGLRMRCGVAARWEYRVAAKLLQYGFALQPGRDMRRAGEGDDGLVRACLLAAKSVRRVPRMEAVADVLSLVAESDGLLEAEVNADSFSAVIGSSLVRTAYELERRALAGVGSLAATEHLAEAIPTIDLRLLAAAREIYSEKPRLAPVAEASSATAKFAGWGALEPVV